jgi:RNA polymerase sigma factor (sigma-70 family)
MNTTQYDHWDGVSFRQWLDHQGGDNRERRKRLLSNLPEAVERELTPRQKQLLEMRYRDEMSVTEMARQLGVDKSTVSHTLNRARRRLSRVLRYSF